MNARLTDPKSEVPVREENCAEASGERAPCVTLERVGGVGAGGGERRQEGGLKTRFRHGRCFSCKEQKPISFK